MNTLVLKKVFWRTDESFLNALCREGVEVDTHNKEGIVKDPASEIALLTNQPINLTKLLRRWIKKVR